MLDRSKSKVTAPLLICVALLVLFTAVRMVVAFAHGSQLGHVTGTWASLAYDLSKGLFYRPLYDPLIGFGGTRYFPLYFSLHALLFLIWPNLVWAGYLATLVSLGVFWSGLYSLLRALGTEKKLSVLLTLASLSSAASQLAVSSIRGDLLPVGLLLWGFSFGCTARNRRSYAWAGLFFVLAFAAKVTAIYGLCVFSLWLCLRPGARLREGVGFFFGSLVGCALMVGFFQWASAGRFWESFTACASAGIGLNRVQAIVSLFFQSLIGDDITSLCFLFLAAGAFVWQLKKNRRFACSLPALFWLASLGATFIILASPGTGYNQFLDLQASAIVILASLARSQERAWRTAERLLWITMAVALWGGYYWLRFDLSYNKFAEITNLVAAVPSAASSKQLSEDPWIPLLKGKQAFVQDAFSIRVLRERRPDLDRIFHESLERKEFGAVFLFKALPEKEHWYRKVHFGPGFVENLGRNYALKENVGRYFLFLPR